MMMTPAKPPGSTPVGGALARRGGRRPHARSSTSSAARVGTCRGRHRRRRYGRARVVIVQGSFPSAHRATRRRVGRGDGRGGGQLRVTPELTRSAASRGRERRRRRRGAVRGAVRQRRGHPVDDSARGGEDAPPRRAFARGLGDPGRPDPRVAAIARRRRETPPPPHAGTPARETRVWGHGEERRGVVLGVCVMRVTRARGATARGCARVGRRRGEGRY